MPDLLFVFFAGIALATGLNYVGFSVLEKGNRTELFFGLFACSAGIYYLSSAFSAPIVITLFFATAMFVLFPWYLAHQAEIIHKKLLVLITALGAGYFLTVLFREFIGNPNLRYFFSYSVYLLSFLYCILSVRAIRKKKEVPIWPFVVVTGYYFLFTAEEIAYDSLREFLPWRKLISFAYLDLFPMIIIAFYLTLSIHDHWIKSSLEKEVLFYKNNLNTILNLTKKFVISLDNDGSIRFANSFFKEFFPADSQIKSTNITKYLPEDSADDFEKQILGSEKGRGELVTQLKTSRGLRTVTWSFVKLRGSGSKIERQYILLFGTDISLQIESQEQLKSAYGQLEILKNKLQAENIQLRNDTMANTQYGNLIGKSPNFNYVLNRVDDVATLDVPVLVEGETGVGKEMIANAIHKKSHRSDNSFIKVNCAAIPVELIESELFGFEKGAFTGADRMKKGMFELAHNGTVFLDEIGELPLSVQPKLLRALQEGEIQRLGAEKVIKVNVRILAATNRNLQDEIEQGRFRSDLFYRINVFPITVPPLRKRKEDIPLLVHAFCDFFGTKYSKEIDHISESLMEDLINYSWPGNVRQLRNIIERAVITSSESVFKLASPLPLEANLTEEMEGAQYLISDFGTLESYEKNYITQVLEHCNWKISGKAGAANILDLPPSTLRSKMKKLGITAAR